MADRFDRFSDRARRTLSAAMGESQQRGTSHIGTEHLLLGLLQQEGAGALRVLTALGVVTEDVRTAVDAALVTMPQPRSDELGLSRGGKTVIELAVDEFRGSDRGEIGTEHLLLGLIREGEGVAGRVLGELGVVLEPAREAVRTLGRERQGPDRSEDGGAGSVGARPSGRFDAFSELTREAFTVAQRESQRRGVNYIGTEHLLLGLLRLGDGAGAQALVRLGIEADALRAAVESRLLLEPPVQSSVIGLSFGARTAIELAVDEAREGAQIGTGQLLIGLIRENEGIAAHALEEVDADLGRVREAVHQVPPDGAA